MDLPYGVVTVGIVGLAVVQLVTALWMAVDPRSFFDGLGGFGTYNEHYMGDAAAFQGGVGLALLAALRWPALRAGALAAVTAMLALHAVNHWIDLGEAHRDWVGVFDGISLTVLTVLAVVLTLNAARGADARGHHDHGSRDRRMTSDGGTGIRRADA